ncbi:fructan hydrolase [Spiroplasma litorale]|uniref:Fructan hydrolase n=1 Tax=Spiroplasma litorale TaxID=216942 RepID=A0A0K1W1W3_9MOLU|nr:glycoside hydrolase family 32 protein [Spiroplasma litorale]AKX34176.1 fructan hydrolase [Spiroplasma litorale]
MSKFRWIITAFALIYLSAGAYFFATLSSYSNYQKSFQERFSNKFHVQMQETGLMNDILGGFYRDGYWHVYYLYNNEAVFDDDGTNHGKWGSTMYHVTTKDWIHWNYIGIAADKDLTYYNDISSGTVFEDKNNFFKYGEGTIIAMVSSFARNEQNIMGYYSIDGGYNFIPIKDTPIINRKQEYDNPGDFRDPFFFKMDGKYVMYLAQNDNFGVWVADEPTGEYFKTGKYYAKHPMLECPNIFQMNVKNSNKKKFVLFYGGNGGWGQDSDNLYTGTYYVVGEIDNNYVFIPDENQETKRFDFGPDYYAAKYMLNQQSNLNVDKLISTAWLGSWSYIYQLPDDGRIGSMSVAREVSLENTGTENKPNYTINSDFLGFENTLKTKKVELINKNSFTEIGGIFKMVINLNNLNNFNSNINFELNANSYNAKIKLDFTNNKISVKRSSTYKNLKNNEGFSNIREYYADLKNFKNNSIEILLDKTTLEMKFPDGSTFTMLKFLEENDNEILTFKTDDNLKINYDYYDLSTI